MQLETVTLVRMDLHRNYMVFVIKSYNAIFMPINLCLVSFILIECMCSELDLLISNSSDRKPFYSGGRIVLRNETQCKQIRPLSTQKTK